MSNCNNSQKSIVQIGKYSGLKFFYKSNMLNTSDEFKAKSDNEIRNKKKRRKERKNGQMYFEKKEEV